MCDVHKDPGWGRVGVCFTTFEGDRVQSTFGMVVDVDIIQVKFESGQAHSVI